jgi:hypothetical protein
MGGATGTAAMAQVPDFSPPVSPMMINPPHMGGAPPVVGLPPSPMTSGRGNKSGGGKGLVIGLGAVGAILLVSIAVLAARSLGDKKDQDTQIIAFDSGPAKSGGLAAGGVTSIDPLPIPSAPPTVASTGAAPSAALPPIDPVKTATGNTGAGTKPTPPAPVSGAKACDACIAAASTGNASAAVGNFTRCDDATKKQTCSQAARNNAPAAAKTAALNGNCGLAKAIIAGAQGMGATSPKLASALAGSSCK